MTPLRPLSFDIFCKVVDNYGDIGVCWRLARRLATHPVCGAVRLWVDDLASFARIAPGIQPDAARQTLQNIRIVRWNDSDATSNTGYTPADVVVEAFACEPPPAYVSAMSAQQLWVNLEYLSAEDWVESCHGLPSMQANGLRKFFFFPGFTPRTGGLLREAELLAQRDAWQADPNARLALLDQLGVSSAWLDRVRAGADLVYVYCYPQAPLPALIQALSRRGRDTLLLLPKGIWPSALPALHANGCRIESHLHDFVDQDTFDRLLWSSDLNVVRGEDSLVRALWAGRAMIWQPYLQADETHLEKLDAWLTRSPWPDDIHQAMRAWNRGDGKATETSLDALLQPERLQQWATQTRSWCEQLAQDQDLADRLLAFCAENAQTR